MDVFAWEPSNYLKPIIKSVKERTPTLFARKSTELAKTAPKGPSLSRSHVNADSSIFSRRNCPITTKTPQPEKRALPDSFCTKGHRISSKGSKGARFLPFGCKRAFYDVFTCELSNSIKHIIKRKNERSPNRFARKSTKLDQTAPEQLRLSQVWAFRM